MSKEQDWKLQLGESLRRAGTLKNWEDFFFRTNCVHYSESLLLLTHQTKLELKSSNEIIVLDSSLKCKGFLLGGGCGTLMFAHKLRTYSKFINSWQTSIWNVFLDSHNRHFMLQEATSNTLSTPHYSLLFSQLEPASIFATKITNRNVKSWKNLLTNRISRRGNKHRIRLFQPTPTGYSWSRCG